VRLVEVNVVVCWRSQLLQTGGPDSVGYVKSRFQKPLSRGLVENTNCDLRKSLRPGVYVIWDFLEQGLGYFARLLLHLTVDVSFVLVGG